MANYYLSEETYKQLQQKLGERGSERGGYGTSAGGRLVTFVTVTAGTANPYTGTIVFRQGDGTLVSYASGVGVREFDGNPLQIGTTYLCLQTGDDGSTRTFLTATGLAVTNFGCGFVISEDGTVVLDVASFVGLGLEIASDEGSGSASGSDTCPQIDVKPGDCIVVDAEGVHVDLTPYTTLTFQSGGEVTSESDGFTVWQSQPVTTYTVSFNQCGLPVSFEEGSTEVVETEIPVDGCCVSGSGSEGSSDCDTEAATTTTFTAGGEVTISSDGYTVTASQPVTTYTVSFNECGLVCGFEATSTEVVETTLPVDGCCGSGSDGSVGALACVDIIGGTIVGTGDYSAPNFTETGTIVMGGNYISFVLT